jgi:phenylacetate-CoA ligase
MQKLKETLVYAYENVPFYKELYDGTGIDVKQINLLEDFESKIPVIDKDMVREHRDKFQANQNVKKFFVTTGGVTGSPMKFWQSNNVWDKELAFVNNYFRQFGYTPQKLKATFRSGSTDYNNLKAGTYWRENLINNEVLFSPFHISQKTIERYVNRMNELKPSFIHGYPSAIYSFVRGVKDKNLKLNFKVDAVFLVSENYTRQQIEEFKSFFNCPISSFYGLSERIIFAPVIDDDLREYRSNPYYGYTELVDDTLSVIKENGKPGELLGTGFDNLAMPLIRYRTGDHTSYIDYEEDRWSPVTGRRSQEFLSGENGNDISLTALNIHSTEFDNVINSQFYQKERGKVVLRVIVNSNFRNEDVQAIENVLTGRVGHALDFKVEVVEHLELTHRGKIKNIVKDCLNKEIS